MPPRRRPCLGENRRYKIRTQSVRCSCLLGGRFVVGLRLEMVEAAVAGCQPLLQRGPGRALGAEANVVRARGGRPTSSSRRCLPGPAWAGGAAVRRCRAKSSD